LIWLDHTNHLVRFLGSRSPWAIRSLCRTQDGLESPTLTWRSTIDAILPTRRPQGFIRTLWLAGDRNSSSYPPCFRSTFCGGGDTGSPVRRLPTRSQSSVTGAERGLGFLVVRPMQEQMDPQDAVCNTLCF
jgi:hypothetical protein